MNFSKEVLEGLKEENIKLEDIYFAIKDLIKKKRKEYKRHRKEGSEVIDGMAVESWALAVVLSSPKIDFGNPPKRTVTPDNFQGYFSTRILKMIPGNEEGAFKWLEESPDGTEVKLRQREPSDTTSTYTKINGEWRLTHEHNRDKHTKWYYLGFGEFFNQLKERGINPAENARRYALMVKLMSEFNEM